MLNELKTFGISEDYFEIKRIGDFENSTREGFSHINTVAIDYDTTTRKLCNEQKQFTFKSCDALDIVVSKNKINFIEFKQLINYPNLEEFITEDLKLPQKIKDSHHVLRDIIQKRKFIHKDKIPKYNSCEKNVIISFTLTDGARRVASLLRILTVKKIIEKQFSDNYIDGENFNEPVYIIMSEFDAKYSQYV